MIGLGSKGWGLGYEVNEEKMAWDLSGFTGLGIPV